MGNLPVNSALPLSLTLASRNRRQNLRALWLVILSCAVVDAGKSIEVSFLALFLTKHLHWSMESAGLWLGAMSSVLTFAFVGGFIGDRTFKRKGWVAVGLILDGIGSDNPGIWGGRFPAQTAERIRSSILPVILRQRLHLRRDCHNLLYSRIKSLEGHIDNAACSRNQHRELDDLKMAELAARNPAAGNRRRNYSIQRILASPCCTSSR